MDRFLILGLLVTIFVVNASESYSEEIDSPAWFKPSLIESNYPVCEQLLAEANETFLSDRNLSSLFMPETRKGTKIVAGMRSVVIESDPNIIMEEVHRTRFGSKQKIRVPTIKLNQTKYYIHEYTNSGCGGACEKPQLVVTDQANPEDWRSLLKKSPLPGGYGWYRLFKDREKNFWLLLLDLSENFVAYKLLKDATWSKACEIYFHPESIENLKGVATVEALKALADLKLSVHGLTRGGGSCGSMKTRVRWASRFSKVLPSVLYRPWYLSENSKRSRFSDSYGLYENDLIGLKEWALMGTSEYEALEHYFTQLDNAIQAIASFYEVKFGWDRETSEQIAETAITTAVSTTIRFYHFNPIKSDAHHALRKAILERHEIDQLKTLRAKIKEPIFEGSESLLSLAVVYPAALEYLIAEGLNPEHENAFGKTPLMYAVQKNQYSSVKLLLEAGANPNARTLRPINNCYYTLQTFNMTPLHYAVRYASPEVIKLLLDYGAVPFIKVSNHRVYPLNQETPLDWLKRYTQKNFDEKNVNISDEVVSLVESWLQPDSEPLLSKHADSYILKAESLYQKGKSLEAYKLLDLALQISPENERALSDISLVGLKLGNLGQSIESASKIINTSSSKRFVANAWLNQGLACQKHVDNGGYSLNYNGKYYCQFGYLYQFYKALETEASSARKNKILEIFNTDRKNYCELPSLGIKIHFQLGPDPESARYNQIQMLFVLHKSERMVNEVDLSWTVQFSDDSEKRVIPRKIDAINLGGHVFSVYKTEEYLQFPYEVFGNQCSGPASIATQVR